MKKIVHVDMDAFYVSVEIRDNPELANHPVAVGGRSQRRGVLSTCNYIARQYGISSAMPTALAKKKCPSLIVVPGRMDVYKETSRHIRTIFERYTSIIEPLSLDEAYLDLTDTKLVKGSATLTALEILKDIHNETGLTASAGISPVKFLSKIASDINKPNGLFTIAPNDVWNFVGQLSLKKIPGIGKVTAEKMLRLGLGTGQDVRDTTEAFLVSHFGKFGRTIWERCHGIDNRKLVTSRVRKSVGVERTFDNDIDDIGELKSIIKSRLYPELNNRAQVFIDSDLITKIGIKVKFSNFVQTTREIQNTKLDLDVFFALLEDALQRGNGKSVRLLGMTVGVRSEREVHTQLALNLPT